MTKPGIDDLQAAVQALQAAFEPFPDKSRRPIRPDQELPLELSDRESGIASTPESAMCWIPTSAWTTEDT